MNQNIETWFYTFRSFCTAFGYWNLICSYCNEERQTKKSIELLGYEKQQANFEYQVILQCIRLLKPHCFILEWRETNKQKWSDLQLMGIKKKFWVSEFYFIHSGHNTMISIMTLMYLLVSFEQIHWKQSFKCSASKINGL